MGFMEMSCREPEEVSYGSEKQRRGSQSEMIITLPVKEEQTVTLPV